MLIGNAKSATLQPDTIACPVEVKSGAGYKKHASLNHAMAENGAKVDRCFVLSTNNVEVANDVTYLPLYMASLL